MEDVEVSVLWSNDSVGNGSEFGDEFNSNGTQLSPEYEYFRDQSRFWVKRILYPLIMCVGVMGNGITIVILTRRRMRSSTNHYLTALAFSDLFYLIFAFTLTLDYYEAFHTYYYFSYWRFAIMLTDACSNTSVWLTVTFTIERYVAVCHPIKGKVFCTRSRAKKVIGCVVCFCFAVVIPTPFEWTILEVVTTDDFNQTSTKFRPQDSALGLDETYRKIYYWFTSITFVILPLTLLTIFNSFLIRSVHQSKTQRRRMTMRGPKKLDNAHQENRITIMLIAVVIMFLLCQLPTAVTLVYNSFYPPPANSNADALLRGLGNLFNCLVAINAACNFILYCAFSDRYRRTFLRIFMPCLFRRGSPNHSQTNFTVAFPNQCQVSEMDPPISNRRHSGEHNSARYRRNVTDDKSNPGYKNGHFNCHQMTTLTPAKHNHAKEVNGQNAVLVEKNGHSHQHHPPLKTSLHVLENGHLTTHDDNGSDTTQETTISSIEGDNVHPNEVKKRHVSIYVETNETENL